jgi:hypothetical protein
MDPVTIFATATALWSGVKAAVEFGQEAEEVLGQLGKWATAVADLQLFFEEENNPPSIWRKPVFEKSATAEAFDSYVAKVRIAQQEREIYQMFVWGALNHLGEEGYREWYQMRLRIKDERDRVINEWKYRRKQALDDLIVYGVLGATVVLLLTFIGCVLWYRHTEIEPYEQRQTEIV